MLRLSALLALLFLAACAEQRDPLAELEAETSAPPTVAVRDTRDVPPGDFSLSITVYSPSSGPAIPPYRRPSRYILEADWVLRVAIGPGCTEQTYPPAIRSLNAAEVQSLWDLAREAGLTTEGGRGRIFSSADYTPPDRGTGYLINTRAGNERRAFVLDPTSPPVRRLVEHLARLSWNAK